MTTEARVALPRRIALLMWGDVIEDFLAPIGWTLDDFCRRMSGGWLFGYIDALCRQGVESTLLVFTRDARAPDRTVHVPSETPIMLLPSPRRYRLARSFIHSPYHWLEGDERVDVRVRWPLAPLYTWLRDAMPYWATPVPLLIQALREARCDAILCQEYEEPRFDAAVRAGVALGLPVFATFQGARARRSRREVTVRPRTLGRAQRLAIGSSREAARVQEKYGLPSNRIVQVFNPVDEDTWFAERVPGTRSALGIPDEAHVVSWHGRVAMAQKGLDLLLRAWEHASREGPRLHLLLIGSGEDAPELARLLAARGERGDVTWIDRYIADRATMRRYLSAADAWVLPSRHEGFAVAPLEAMACGLPVIACDVEGIADVAPNGEQDGILRVPVDDERALADAIVRVACDDGLRTRMRLAGLQRIRSTFGSDAVGRQLVTLLAR